jgi:DNA-binding winged helix-turn-helix (wHTH) protein/tetratricopeptide (TPR) repeat protein
MADPEPLRLRFDAFELDEGNARLTRDGRPVALPPKAFGVLCALARRPGQLVTKDALLDAVWGHQHVSESVLKTTISALRVALADDAKQPRLIETAARRGYRFIGSTEPRRVDIGAMAFGALHGSRQGDGPPTIGRHQNRDRLNASWHQALSGKRQVFLVAGEAGVGKTTLVDSFASTLDTVACARGQCVEQYGAGEPYLPVLEALGSLCRSDPALVPMMRSVAPTWLLQLPWLSSEAEREALRRELAGTTQDRMLREFAELVDLYTAQRPLLLITEDLHWCDHATVRLIDHVARRRDSARLLWIGSFRLAEIISEDHPLKALRHELRLHRLCDEVVLEPFSESEVAEYVAARVPDSQASEAFVRALHAHTDGLPLFLVSVVDDLVAQGTLSAAASPSREGTRPAALQVPENLAGVIEKQMARLPADLKAVLTAGSVCGAEFRPATVADVLEKDAGWVIERCETLVQQRQWLRELELTRLPDGSLDPRYGFGHALYQHVLYQGLGGATRAQWHRRVAQSLERGRSTGLPIAAAELASHFERGLDPMAALRHYAAAAANAFDHFAPMEVVTLTTRALALLSQCPETAERHALELALISPRSAACAQVFGVNSPEASAAFERTHALHELLPAMPMRGAELSGLGWVFWARGQYDQALAVAERLQQLAESCDDTVMRVAACNLMGSTLTHQGRVIEGTQWFERGLALDAKLGGYPPFVADFGVSIGVRLALNLAQMGFPEKGRAHVDAALARAERIGQPFTQMLALTFAALMEAKIGDAVRMQTHADALREKIAVQPLGLAEGYSLWLNGTAMARLGQPEAGYELIRRGVEHNARIGNIGGSAAALGYGAEALLLAGRIAEARIQIDAALERAREISEPVHLPDLRVIEAAIADAEGSPVNARHALDAALAEAHRQQSLWIELHACVALCVRPDARPGDRARLEATFGRLREGHETALAQRARALLTAGNSDTSAIR